jgi:tetratricopeptide (TPR) repeat protein
VNLFGGKITATPIASQRIIMRWVLLFLLVIAATGSLCLADVLYLRNQEKVEGVILSQSGDIVQIQAGSIKFIIEKNRIEKIVKERQDTAWVRLGDAAFRAEKFPEARECYLKALAVTEEPAVVRERLDQVKWAYFEKVELPPADAAYQRGEYQKAADLFMALVRKYPDEVFTDRLRTKSAAAYFKLADAAYTTGQEREFYFNLKRCLHLDPRSVEAHVLLGKILRNRGKYRIAAEEFAIALAYDVRNNEARDELASLGEHFSRAEIDALGKPSAKKPLDLEYLYNDDLLHKRTQRMLSEQKTALTGSLIKNDRSLSLLLQAYNAGPWAVVLHDGSVSYRETRDYVPRVLHWLHRGVPSSDFDPLIEKYARTYGLDPQLVKAIIKVESDFNTRCVSRADARGLMQIVREDWNDTTRRIGVNWDFDVHAFEPEKNIRVGCHYLRWLARDFLPEFFSEGAG